MDVDTRSEDEELGRAIKQVQWGNHRALDSRLRAVGSTIVQWDVLRALSRNPAASAHELAVATFQSDQSLGVMMRGMERKGLVERSTPHGRRIEHRITDAGERVLEVGHQAAAEVFRAAFAPLDQAERATLLGLLRRLVGD
ncbi:MarR family winged helix-turn-helix transcriptional regulator [Amnibacterium kyonggiense]|uniref:DNA-binding MarR family transcriptional regulator n=1 Tax=Amnibacterium kyonggiense TaxID=595671 RepID=A0A4R7FPW2_9MICO|nr:MarR family transcriptional regulator [Amnibacterium kyonggiense]TDS79609.1 DNA-binding MarR family transcriptional regulator [Amnibacterium kyonggiense]